VTRLLRTLLSSSRFFIIFAIIGSFLASAAALVYGFIATVQLVLHSFGSGDYTEHGTKVLSVGLVGMIDMFLLGTVLYIITAGLYQLFIDPSLPLPAWLKISTLDDLKERLLGVVVVLLAVSFLGDLVEWDGSWNILAEGLAVGTVVGVLALTMAILARIHPPGHGSPQHTPDSHHPPPDAPPPPAPPAAG
jgi:uncharacterized membrane protein YqhA